MKPKTVIISGINMVEGGIFTILDNCLKKISIYSKNRNIRIIALVNDSSQFDYPNIEYIAFPKSKKSWFLRLYYEYFYFKKLSKNIKPDIWFSLHDISPSVLAKKRFVYCHNATVFFKPTLKDWKFDFKIGLFSLFYYYLYRINIKKNTAVFVQQHWIKKEFQSLFTIKNVRVCKPESIVAISPKNLVLEENKIHFFYPLIAKSFKNIEYIGEAVQLLSEDIQSKIKIHITIQVGNSSYEDYIISKYTMLEMNYIGKINREDVFAYYQKMDCLLFPSKLETWGLPISEAKAFQKPMFLANLPYAKETVGDYETVSFFDIENPMELSKLIKEFVNKTIVFQGNNYPYKKDEQFNDWDSVFNFILKD